MFSITKVPPQRATQAQIDEVINDKTILTDEEKALKTKITELNTDIINLSKEITDIDNPAIEADILAIENAQIEITKLTAILKNLRKTDVAGYNALQGQIDILKAAIEAYKLRCSNLNIANDGKKKKAC